MNIDDFQDLVDRCGERPEDWPDDVRAEATKFFLASSEAQAVVAEAKSMRNLFAGQTLERAPEHLSRNIFALAERMDDYRPTVNRDLKHGRVSFSENSRTRGASSSERQKSVLPPSQARPPKLYLWLGTVFLAGLSLGIASTTLGGDRHIDFATLFAIIS